MDGAIAKINARIERAQDEIRAAFADLKKVEITQKNREDREEAEQNRKETIMLDEIGLETFRRNEETKE
jgi:nicotinate-nucleotide pyrophosphorylase